MNLTTDHVAEIVDTGHFALEEDGDAIAQYIDRFLTERQQHLAA